MKKLYHVCLTAHSEVLLRNEENVALFTNLSALAAWRNCTDILTDAIMSTHLHFTCAGEDIKGFPNSLILSATKAFNKRNGRIGPLFDGPAYVVELNGPRHIQMALNYSLRQGLHHGQSETAFSYPYCTANSLFMAERGLTKKSATYASCKEIRMYLPKNADFPDNWRADENGILTRDSFEELSLVENWYGTARNYLFSMVRKTSEEWIMEQQKDGVDDPPVTLTLLENGYSPEDVSTMLAMESNIKYSERPIPDMEICRIIDGQMLGRFRAGSVYQLDGKQKMAIARELKYDLGIRTEKQISRCLAMDYCR